MEAILALALLTNMFDMIGGPAPSFDMIGDVPRVQRILEEETDEESSPATLSDDSVVVYVDLSDIKSVRSISNDISKVGGVKFILRDKSQVQVERWKDKLPLIQYHTDDGWKYLHKWPGSVQFANLWTSGNSGTKLQTEDEDKSIRQSTPRSQSEGSHYAARSYEWKLVGNDNASALRNHLSTPSSEHHGAYFDREWLNGLSLRELRGLHSDAHNNQVQWQYVNKQSSPPKAKKRSFVSSYKSGYCPTGNCPWN